VDEPPKATKKADPRYPDAASADCQEDTVLVMMVIDAAGLVTEAEALESPPGLDQAAIECVKSSAWRSGASARRGRPGSL
jgi:TonB family protein